MTTYGWYEVGRRRLPPPQLLTRWRKPLVASVVLIALLGAGGCGRAHRRAASADTGTGPRPEASGNPSQIGPEVTRACGDAAYGRLGKGWRSDPDTIRAGPLYFVYARGNRTMARKAFRGRGGRYPGQKMLIVVLRGRTAALAVPTREQRRLALLYSATQEALPAYSLREGETAVRFTACSDRDTQFNGGLILTGPQCATLNVRAGRSRSRVSIPFGTGAAPC